MGLRDVTDPTAVKRAMVEFDQLGRSAFLSKYGFGSARSYFLVEDGRRYDSKALIGAAHGFQHGTPLRASEFSGGEQTVARVLGALGFEVAHDPSGVSALIVGDVYRRSDLHELYKGQQQGGISTPAESSVIMLFTGYSGPQHGYEDGWSEGVFCYFGEGQVGDMLWVRGNAAVRDHAKNGRDLLLFQMLEQPRSHVRFLGSFNCASWEYRPAPDRQGKARQAIVFHLAPVGMNIGEVTGLGDDLPELRAAADLAGSDTPTRNTRQALVAYVQRSIAVRNYALARSGGACEHCAHAAPFRTVLGAPFLEIHHIRRLTDGGPDRVDSVAALCPNCHREAHYGENRDAMKAALLSKIGQKEAVAAPATR
jgi:5-methylcytosine-specific restriction enzyme A